MKWINQGLPAHPIPVHPQWAGLKHSWVPTASVVFFQSTIEELERERNMLADSMEAKLWDHQQLLRVKMDLGMEVAAYR